MREIKLPSGATLKIPVVPFATAKALYQALLAELKNISIDPKGDTASLFKDLFCVGFSSPKIEACLWECFKRCLYNELKIDDQTFEPVERRDDYMKVCVAVATETVTPFAKSLYAEYQNFMATIPENIPA